MLEGRTILTTQLSKQHDTYFSEQLPHFRVLFNDVENVENWYSLSFMESISIYRMLRTWRIAGHGFWMRILYGPAEPSIPPQKVHIRGFVIKAYSDRLPSYGCRMQVSRALKGRRLPPTVANPARAKMQYC